MTNPTNQFEENPFTDPVGAREWILAVESESNGVRDKEIYPRLNSWSNNLPPKTAVLEIGAGQGACSKHINQEYYGVEPSTLLVERAIALYGDWFSVGNIYEINQALPNFSFGAVFSVNVWWHLKNLTLASQQFLSVISPGDSFLIITGNPAAWDDWKSLFTITEETDTYFAGHEKTLSTPLSRDIFYTHSAETIIEHLKNAGADTIETELFGTIEGFTNPAFIQITGTRST